jgi:hypothetical protein
MQQTELCALLGILIATAVRGGAESLKGLSKDGGQTGFHEYLRASLFNDVLPIDTSLSQINLNEQYL